MSAIAMVIVAGVGIAILALVRRKPKAPRASIEVELHGAPRAGELPVRARKSRPAPKQAVTFDPGDLPPHYYEERLDRRLVAELIGIAKGVIADGDVSMLDIKTLMLWLDAHPEVTHYFPGRELTRRLLTIAEDGIVTDEERDELLEYLRAMSGGLDQRASDEDRDRGASGARPTEIPFSPSDTPVTFNDRRFVLTGTFAYGTRAVCHDLTRSLGAEVGQNVTKKTHYLVVGQLGSDAWVTSSFGLKIMKAVELKESGVPIEVISEAHWLEQARKSPGVE